MIPEHILTSDLYKQLYEDYDKDMSFLDKMVIVNYEKIENDKQFKEFVDNCNYWCVNNVPFAVLDYAFCDNVTEILEEMKKKYGSNNEIIKKINLCHISKKNKMCNNAARNGHLNCLKYAHENGCPSVKNVYHYAIIKGHLECLKYAYENDCPMETEICIYAAKYGHLDCLKYFHKKGCSLFQEACKQAVKNGHFECVKYLHQNGCKLYINMYKIIAKKGYIDCLKYMHEKGYPMHRLTYSIAKKYGHMDCAEYALKQQN